MVMTPQHPAFRTNVAVQGRFFGARGGSCSCDPCDCNPCHCGDALPPNLPLWRVSGCALSEGIVGEIDLSHLVLLSLAQPREDATWEEILLVDHRATSEQIEALLTLFDETLESMPAEVGSYARTQRAVYRVPIDYTPDEQRPLLRVNVSCQQLLLVRAGENQQSAWPCEWTYDGPMALREPFHLYC
jgi:hypothetical protein